ncbi:CapA family protein [Paenibacillus contaminans]|uniref:CapA family protein n=1 Tax=Paenibacillus contaminans TaxID=450362 RepID=A0A329M4Y4_9BACL|nr:CapA family protein [Paenibacillus contaminans]RAV14236.1 CapA family protein [Paenibacillus contaminans]
MATEITIAAIGDLLMKKSVIAAAKRAGRGKRHVFDGMFAEVAPLLKQADLTIGNLETTFAGRNASGVAGTTESRHPKTNFPRFNCPDSFAGTLKRLGFDVMTTANNHCVDHGIGGLNRTLNVLDRAGLAHTGTSRTAAESGKLLIRSVKGVRVGILAYTQGTNRLPVPKGKTWAVNKIRFGRIASDLRRMRRLADVTVVCIHFGSEYKLEPNAWQKQVVRKLFALGADVVLGAHPHVLQRHSLRTVKDASGRSRRRYVIYSMGNFIGSKLKKNDHTKNGVIVRLTIRKQREGLAGVVKARAVPTWIGRPEKAGHAGYRLHTMRQALARAAKNGSEARTLRRVNRRAATLFGSQLS